MKKISCIICLAILILSLPGCNTTQKQSQPNKAEEVVSAEVQINGYTVTLGVTTIKDLLDQGYKFPSYGGLRAPMVVNKNAEYLDITAKLIKNNKTIEVVTRVPWSGNTKDLSREYKMASSSGIIREVMFKADSDNEIIYNNKNLKEVTADYAKEEWGAVQDSTSSNNRGLEASFKNIKISGTLNEDNTSFEKIGIRLDIETFEELIKDKNYVLPE